MARQFSLVAQIPPIELLPPAADAAGRTSPFRSLRNAMKAYVEVHLGQGAANTVALTLQQATNVAGAGAKAVGATPIWSNLNTTASDALVSRPPAAGYTTDAGIFGKIIIFEIVCESCMDLANNYDCIAISTGASAAGNITSARLHILGAFQGAVLPNSYVD
jgi:hypothetical protein